MNEFTIDFRRCNVTGGYLGASCVSIWDGGPGVVVVNDQEFEFELDGLDDYPESWDELEEDTFPSIMAEIVSSMIDIDLSPNQMDMLLVNMSEQFPEEDGDNRFSGYSDLVLPHKVKVVINDPDNLENTIIVAEQVRSEEQCAAIAKAHELCRQLMDLTALFPEDMHFFTAVTRLEERIP